jgi:hypothetical protein
METALLEVIEIYLVTRSSVGYISAVVLVMVVVMQHLVD